jgi:hypothetical protein
MPLRRAFFHNPITDLDIHSVRFPLADGDKLVWGEVTDHALRERALRDEIKTGLEKAALFERYRVMLEMLAGELYDAGKWLAQPDGTIVVRVPNDAF